MAIRSHSITFESDGTAVEGTISTPPAEYAGMWYRFNPNSGSGDITVQNRGRTVHSKSNAVNSDGLQDVALDGEKIVDGPIVIGVSDLAPGDVVDIRIFLRV